jgi:hypothetical protein
VGFYQQESEIREQLVYAKRKLGNDGSCFTEPLAKNSLNAAARHFLS